MSEIYLSEIYIYPIKSLGGIKLESSEFGETGLQYDRRWMLINKDNKFITQREFSKMSLISTKITNNHLVCIAKDMDDLYIPFENNFSKTITVNVWRSFCEAQTYENKINQWFSEFLNTDTRLVFMPETTKRSVNPDYAINNDIVSFADGYPFLVIGQGSLDDLNSKLYNPISMNRFRPNFVINGSTPFMEDEYKNITIGNNKFFIVKPCERCVITTIEQSKGISEGKEPLKTLSEYRKINNKVIFGQNLLSENKSGFIKVGDKVSLI